MQEANFNVEEFNADNRYAGDENLFVRFFTIPVEDKEASAEAGRPIYTEREMCGIRVPGKQHENCYPTAGRMKGIHLGKNTTV